MSRFRYSAEELYEMLCSTGESNILEAKEYDGKSLKSVMESVCAFSNDLTGLGGYILLGVREERNSPVPRFTVVGIETPEKAIEDIASQCGTAFNRHIYPEVTIEQLQRKKVIVIRVDPLYENEKPLFLLKHGLPKGAYRRVGSTDQRCDSESLRLFYQNQDTDYDRTPVKEAYVDEIDENAVKQYRRLRAEAAPNAEELSYGTAELMEALNCVNPENKKQLNLAGVLVFGTQRLQRRTLPTERIDYIRIPGNEWLGNDCDTYQFTEINGPLITAVYSLLNTIQMDLSKTFLGSGNDLQAKTEGLPIKVLREALVNAIMHRSYQVSRNTQVVRYDNRIEITNAGYSLKSDDDLGSLGSVLRNRVIASIFHETQLAEIKGSGIRQMKRLMKEAKLMPPIYKSNRESNTFTVQILLHHFFGKSDLDWLKPFERCELTDHEKAALLFLREVGAIDIKTYQQIAECSVYAAAKSLSKMSELGILEARGSEMEIDYQFAEAIKTSGKPSLEEFPKSKNETSGNSSETALLDTLPPALAQKIVLIRSQKRNMQKEVSEVIAPLCAIRPMRRSELTELLGRSESYLKNIILKPLLEAGVLRLLYPGVPKHPQQAYIASKPPRC